jgi:ketosteroid isomerase-like protein
MARRSDALTHPVFLRQDGAMDIEDVVKSFYAATNRGDLDAAMEAFARDAEWHQITAVPDRSVYRGSDRIREFLKGLMDDFGLQTDLRSMVMAGDHVTALGSLSGRTLSGLELEFSMVHVWRFAGDRCVWLYDCCGVERDVPGGAVGDATRL